MSSEETTKKKKRPPAYLFALGREELPGGVGADGGRWRFVKLFKHDFFVATGLHENDEILRTNDESNSNEGMTNDRNAGKRLAVLKVQRTYPMWGFPMRWLGKRVAGHETRIY